MRTDDGTDPIIITRRALGNAAGATYWRHRYERLPVAERPRVAVTIKVGTKGKQQRVVGSLAWTNDKTIFILTANDGMVEVKRNDKIVNYQVLGVT